MGAGASSAAQDMEEILAATSLLQQAITALTFPDMYRLYDFQVRPSLPFNGADGQETQLATRSDGGDADDPFTVKLGNDTILIENLRKANAAGWTPLHSCCHTQMSIAAALAIIDEMYDRGISFEAKTIRGPGSHNSGWTALHMACAYGLESVVAELISKGASVNSKNSLDWSPLHETCHRGMESLTQSLLRAGADPTHIPDLEASRKIPFSRPPPTTALGAAARHGSKEVVQVLLNFGVPKNAVNYFGWTALHEAVFNNHAEVVQLLLVHGADPTVANKQGACPIHLASNPEIKSILTEMGAEETPLRLGRESPFVFTTVWSTPSELSSPKKTTSVSCDEKKDAPDVTPEKPAAKELSSPDVTRSRINTKVPSYNNSRRIQSEEAVEGKNSETSDLLHSGGMLGNLPSLGAHKSPMASTAQHHFGLESAMQMEHNTATRYFQEAAASAKQEPLHMKPPAHSKLPPEFLCEVTKKPLKDPVRTPYGNVFEREIISQWFDRNGSICPVTGLPLCQSELEDAVDLVQRMEVFRVEESLKEGQQTRKGYLIAPEASLDDRSVGDELYDFNFTPR